MADGFTGTLESKAVLDALRAFPDVVLKYTKPASKVSADSIAREAQRRVRRQSDETMLGITVEESYDGTGYVVLSRNRRMPNLPLWIEAGTRRGKPGSHADPGQPYFYPSARLEMAAHERRIIAAVNDATDAIGLGE